MDEQHKLLKAVSHGEMASFREMCSKKPGHNLANCVYEKTGDSAVHVAVKNGHLDVLKYVFLFFTNEVVVRIPTNQNDIEDTLISDALHIIFYKSRFLHNECGMSLEQTNFDGKRPLHDAAQFSRLECLKYLIQQGISVFNLL